MSEIYKTFDDSGLTALANYMKTTRTKANSNEEAIEGLGEDLATLSGEVVTALSGKAAASHEHLFDRGVTTEGDGAAYTATVEGITALEAGLSFIMIPHTASTSQTATLNVNGLGAKQLRRPVSSNNATTVANTTTSWLYANKPVRVMYNGTYWIVTDMPRPHATDLYGTLPAASGGTGVTSIDELKTVLGISSGAGGGSEVVKVTMPKGRMKGDIDGDGEITTADFMLVTSGELDDIQKWCADVNGDTLRNNSDLLAIRAYIAKASGLLTKTPCMADYYGNWTYVKVDDLSGYFYYDMVVEGITAASSAIVAVQGNHKRDAFAGAECMDGVVRVKANLLPLEDVVCLVFHSPGDGTAVVVPENVIERTGAPLSLTVTSTSLLKIYTITIDDAGVLTATRSDGVAYTFTGTAVTT